MNARRILGAFAALALGATGCDSTTNTYFVADLAVSQSPNPTPQPACSKGDKQCIDFDLFRLCHDDGTWGADQQCPDGTLCQKGDCVSPAPSVAPCFPGDTQCAPGMDSVILTCRAAGDGYDVSNCPTGTACDPASFACAGACGPIGATLCNQNDISKIDTCDGNVITTKACPTGQLCVTGADGADACAPADCDPRSTCVVCGNPTLSTIDPGSTLSFCNASPLGYKWESLNCSAPNGVCDPKGGGACAEGGAGAVNATCAASVGAVCSPGQTRCSADFNSVQTCSSKGQWATSTTCNFAKNEVCELSTDQTTFICGDEACANNSGACVLSGGVSKIRRCDATGHLSATATACATGRCVAPGAADDNGDFPGDCASECTDGESRCVAGGVSAIQSCTGGVWTAATTTCQSDGGVGVVQCVSTTDPDTGLNHAFCGQCTPGKHRCSNSTGGIDAGASFPFIETCGADGTWGAPVECALGVCAGPEGAAACRVACVPTKTVCLGDQLDPTVSPVPLFIGRPAALPCNADGTLPAVPDCAGNPTATGCCQPSGGAQTSCRTGVSGNALGCVQCVGSTPNEIGLIDTRCTDVTGTQQESAAANDCGDANHVAVETCKSDNTWGPPTQCASGQTCLDPVPPDHARDCAPCAGGETGASGACTETNLQAVGFTGCGDPLLNAGAGYGAPGTCGAGVTDCCHSACEIRAGAPAVCIVDGDC